MEEAYPETCVFFQTRGLGFSVSSNIGKLSSYTKFFVADTEQFSKNENFGSVGLILRGLAEGPYQRT